MYWSQHTQFTHALKDASSTITTMYLWNIRSNNRPHTAKITSISTSQRTDMVRQNIISPKAVSEEGRTREDSWLHSAGWLIRQMRKREILSSSDYYKGIYLFNGICKLFNNVLLYLYRPQLSICFKQFKARHSTSL